MSDHAFATHFAEELAEEIAPFLDEGVLVEAEGLLPGRLRFAHNGNEIGYCGFPFGLVGLDTSRLEIVRKIPFSQITNNHYKEAGEVDLRDPGFVERVAETINNLYAEWLSAKDAHREAWLSGWTP